MKKILVICGPTATGKTKLALDLAKKFNGVVISADSRQVYKHMDIGTGKEGNVRGYDLINPDEEFSVSHYLNFVHSELQKIYSKNKLPILVGGTGLYIKAVVDGLETSEIMPDKILRENLKDKTTQELFKILQSSDPHKASQMNDSDSKNPRRLIRAIEIVSKGYQSTKKEKQNYEVTFIGLIAPVDILQQKINKRVDDRIKNRFWKEVEFLKRNNYWNKTPQFTLGYKQWPDVDEWKKEEFKYAKRQITWFKKDTRIKWYDITDKDFREKVEKLIKKCYI